MQARHLSSALPSPSEELLAELRKIYEDLHAHPELSMQEHRTAKIAARWLEAEGYAVTEGVGGTGVVGLLENGEGPTVLLRADMDGLPVKEMTGLPYASRQTGIDRFGQSVPVAHACGHDMHVTWLMGVARILAKHREGWRGTAMLVFQPGEEIGRGARAMIDDGMLERFPRPDVVLGQHVMPLPAGRIGYRAGTFFSAGDSWEITLHGRGAHGSMPERSVDPVVLAAAVVMRLQTVVAREIGTREEAVLTVGALNAGIAENVIPEKATLRLNIRTFEPAVRDRVLAAVRRIVEGEAAASGCPRPPTFETISEFPLTRNDEGATKKAMDAIGRRLGEELLDEVAPSTASEDFSLFATAWGVPSTFWMVGGTDPAIHRAAQEAGRLADLPVNHSPDFAPVQDPTLRVGIEAMLAAAGAWLVP